MDTWKNASAMADLHGLLLWRPGLAHVNCSSATVRGCILLDRSAATLRRHSTQTSYPHPDSFRSIRAVLRRIVRQCFRCWTRHKELLPESYHTSRPVRSGNRQKQGPSARSRSSRRVLHRILTKAAITGPSQPSPFSFWPRIYAVLLLSGQRPLLYWLEASAAAEITDCPSRAFATGPSIFAVPPSPSFPSLPLDGRGSQDHPMRGRGCRNPPLSQSASVARSQAALLPPPRITVAE